jgi:glutathione S-transferase
MQLLYTKRSPYARKVRVLALEKEINLDLIDEDLANKSPRLKQANPLGKVPTLILDNGKTVYDSKVIAQFLEASKPQPPMIPRGGQELIDVLKWEAMADDLVTVAINAYMEKIRHPQDFNAAFVTTQEQAIKDAFAYIESHLSELKEFHLGSINVACAIGYVHFRLPHLNVQGKLALWFDEVSKRPSMQQTIPTV